MTLLSISPQYGHFMSLLPAVRSQPRVLKNVRKY
jgi:hypothetical protein